MRSRPAQTENDIDLSSLPSVLKRSLAKILLAAVAVGALTYAGLMLVPSQYTSEAQIRIGAPSLAEPGRAGGAEAAALKVDREAIKSRVQELRSPDLARKLAAELRLNLRPEFNSALESSGMAGAVLRLLGVGGQRPGETEEERVLAGYYRALQVYEIKETRVINLAFSARDGELAATAANRLIELYQDWLRQQGVTETTDANAWLVPEIEKRARELAAAEAEAEKFRSSANLFRGGGNQPSGLAEQQLTDLTSELTKARGQRGEAQARAAAARELMGRGSPDAVPDVQKSPVIQGLIAQRVRAERDLAEAATQLLPAHPRMKQLNAHVLDIRRQVQKEAATIVDGLEREVKALSLREELASRSLEEAKARMGNKAGDRVRLAQLEDDVKAKRREVEALRERYESARSRGTTKSVPVEVQVIATARPSSKPAWPNRPQIAALASAATLVLGLVLVLFRELLAGNDRRPAAGGLRGEAGQATQGLRPAPVALAGDAPVGGLAASRTGTGAAGIQTQRRTEPVADASGDTDQRHATVAGVVERLVGNSAGQGGYRTLIVGESQGIDVREEAADIAAGLSAAGRQVVLVDWSPKGKGIADALGVPASPGFTELMAGAASFEEVIRTLPDGDVHVLPCGAPSLGAKAGLDPDRLNLLLDALDEAYGDVVITGSYDEVRDLFQTIEGRVDAGVVVSSGSGAGMGEASGRQFLGFEVTEIDVIRLEMPRAAAVAAARNGARRLARSHDQAAAPPAG